MTRWFRSYWDEENTWFYFEVGDDGWVRRQVELEGHVEEPLTLEDFEAVWSDARQRLTAGGA